MPDQRNGLSGHLDEEMINLFLDGMLDEPARRWTEAHLATCARCRAELGRWHELFVALDALAPVTRTALTSVTGPLPRVSSRRIRPWLAAQGIVAAGLLFLVWPRIAGWVGGIAPDGVRAWLTAWATDLTGWLAPIGTSATGLTVWLGDGLTSLWEGLTMGMPAGVSLLQWGVVIAVLLVIWLLGNRLLLKDAHRQSLET
jgi:anti-sigma factor RsiW